MSPGHSCVSGIFCCPWTLLYPPLFLLLPPTTALSANGHSCVFPYFDRCSQKQPYLPTDVSVSFPLLNVLAPSDRLIRPWTFWCPFLFRTLLPTTALSALGHFGSFPLCLNVAPGNSPICQWTFWCPFLFRTLLPTTALLSANGHFGVLPSLPVSTGFSFTHYHHRCQDFCSLHGYCLTLEERQCTQRRPCAQNLASSPGAGMVLASGSGLTCHVIS
jgi:hypothetical protein